MALDSGGGDAEHANSGHSPLTQLSMAVVCIIASSGCAPRQDACAASGYDQNVCADEQNQRDAVIRILGGQHPYQLPMPQNYAPQRQSYCTSLPNGAGGFYTTCQ
jgi:hypothetical protein